MTRAALAVVSLAVVLGAQTAAAASPTSVERRTSPARQQQAEIATLVAQVRDLGATVKALQKTVATLQKKVNQTRNEVTANFAGDACLAAVTADALQGSWSIVDQLVVATGKPAIFGPQTMLNDKDACAAFKIATRAIAIPPSAAGLGSYIVWAIG